MPNITGEIGGIRFISNSHASGAFTNYNSAHITADGDGGDWWYGNFHFDASKSNEIYGNSNTVQSPALSLIPQIKF